MSYISRNIYTSRSSGYKYRSLSTNTGDKKSRDSKEDSIFDKKVKELHREIGKRVDVQVTEAQKARDSIREKFERIDAKIDSMLELQNTVAALRMNLVRAENAIADMSFKINKIAGAAAIDSEGIMSEASFVRAPASF